MSSKAVYDDEREPIPVSAENIALAINIANDYRRVMGDGPIDDLPPGEFGARKCVLARAFNYGGYVAGMGDNWSICFEGEGAEQKAKAFANLIEDGKPAYQHYYVDYYVDGAAWNVDLPIEVSIIAQAFDCGDLDDKYYSDTVSPTLKRLRSVIADNRNLLKE